jgi:hypothetical protein
VAHLDGLSRQKEHATDRVDNAEVGRWRQSRCSSKSDQRRGALIERLAGKVILEIEFGPQTRKVIEALVAKGEREPAAGAPPAR